jgi:hypothetical protein
MIMNDFQPGPDTVSDLQKWVELRGFEPLTPSMRTRISQSNKDLNDLRIFNMLQVRGLPAVPLHPAR